MKYKQTVNLANSSQNKLVLILSGICTCITILYELFLYFSASSEEHAKLERAHQCSKHILEYVNQAVKEYENHYKLEHLQRKIERKSDGVSNQEESRPIKVGITKWFGFMVFNASYYVPATKWLGHIMLPMSVIPK